MAPRLKATAFATRSEFEQACDQAAELDVQIRAAEAARDREIQAVRDEHEPLIQSLKQRREGLTAAADKYAETHRAELFPTVRKSTETALSNIGFRIGNPTLKLLNKKWTWDSVLEAVKAAYPGRYVRVSEAVDKEALKNELEAPELAAIGCRIDQAEAFYIEPKEQPSESQAA